MKKTIFLALFSFVLIFFLLSTRTASAQLANACYSGSWVQPTCNPATSNPGSCNILPPLFSGAACDQHTGYLRIQDELDAADQTTWTQIYPGKIMVGNVVGQWVVPDGGVEINGPIISGSFTSAAPPTAGYNSTGDIASLDSILAGGALRVNGAGNFYGQINAYNRVVISGSVTTGALLSVTNGSGSGNATTLALRQAGGDVGLILDLNTADSNNINIDYLGYVNATKDFQIRLDSDNNSAGSPFDNKFRINNGSNNPVFIVDETGSVTVNNNLGVSGAGTITNSLTAGTVTTNSGGVGNGAIRGKFVESVTGNTCANNQLLVYQTTGSPGWYCVASTNVGTTTVGTLLQVLQAGADAEAFANPVTIGVGSITDGSDHGLTIIGNTGQYPVLNLKDREANNTAGAYLGVIQFGDSYNVYNQARIQAIRGASGSGGDYPTNMSFWTTPDASVVAQERMTILHNGNVGIATNAPDEKFEVYDNTAGAARLRITDITQNPELQLQYNVGVNDHWGIYNNQSDDSLRFWANSADQMTILQSGRVGIGTSTPVEKVEINDATAGTARLRITDTGQNPELQLQYGTAAANHWSIYNNQSDDSLRFWANSADRMAIMQGGFVGVGTTTPVSMFHIHGNSGLSWNSGFQLTRTGYSGDFRINVTSADTYFRNMTANQNFEFRNSADTNIFKVYAASPYAITGNFAATNGTSCTNGQILIKDSSNLWVCSAPPSGADNLGNHTATTNLQMATYDIYGSSGSASADGNFDISGVDNIGAVSANFSGNIYTSGGTIRGNFVDYLGGGCTNGQVLIKNASSQWVCGTASGSDNLGNHTATQNLDMSNFSITNVNKITVTTIDPVYTIKGEKYATYMAGMTGVKEETTGLVNLVYNKKTGLAELVLDFDTLEKGSDVWLFAQTIKYTENFDKVVVLLTPSFDGRVWYEKDESAHTITIVGKPINSFAKDYEVSYRLTGPRFDYQQWPNTTDEEVEGLIIE